jgi:hypothetical protein
MSDQTTAGDQSVQLIDIMQSREVPKLYINGFSIGTSLSDVFVIAQTAGSTSAVLLMSFTTAKTLVRQLGDLVSDFEQMTGQELLTMEDIKEATDKAAREEKT